MSRIPEAGHSWRGYKHKTGPVATPPSDLTDNEIFQVATQKRGTVLGTDPEGNITVEFSGRPVLRITFPQRLIGIKYLRGTIPSAKE